jgi:hypothetical protein
MGCDSSYFMRKPFPRAVYETLRTSDHYAEAIELISLPSGLCHQRDILSENCYRRAGIGLEQPLSCCGWPENFAFIRIVLTQTQPSTIVRRADTRPISQEQLVAEVKGIYAGLVMVEGKCIQVDSKQAALAREAPAGTQPKLNNEQWQALIVLH